MNPTPLHIIDSGGLYGAEIMLLHLMEAQAELGLEPVLASIGSPDCGDKAIEIEARRRGLRVEIFRMCPGPNWPGALKILRFARREKFDLLHSHGYKGNILFGLLPKRLRALPMIITLHGWTWTGGWNRMGVYEWLDGLSLQFADGVVLVNRSMKMHPRIKKLKLDRVTFIDNGICLNSSKSKTPDLRDEIIRFSEDGFSIVGVGRLSPEKGFDLLIEAVAGLIQNGRDLRLVIMGQGKLRPELEQKVQDLGVNHRVMFAGYVNNAKDYLHCFNLFCLPSLTEGLPMVLLEAMAAHIPIVGSRVGGIPEVLNFGRAGITVEPGSVESLRGAIVRVAEQPRAIKEKVQEAANRVEKFYSSQAMAIRYLNVYQDILIKRNIYSGKNESRAV